MRGVKGTVGKNQRGKVEDMPSKNQLNRVDVGDLIDVPGGAKLIFVSSKTVQNWLSRGFLSRFKVRNGRTLVSKKELVAMIQKRGA